MFRIKICGLTTPKDAAAAAAAGADAVGLNFYAKSPRCIDPDRAAAIIAALPPGIVKVGLFVNTPPDEVAQRFDRLGLDLIQLHGDEPPEHLAALAPRPVMRAMRLGPDGMLPVDAFLADCRAQGHLPHALLLDAFQPGQYGGTGATADWSTLAAYEATAATPPIVLAGGLTPANVADAIRAVRPAAVDTASGVESSPGRKDPALVAAFVRAARAAFDQIGL